MPKFSKVSARRLATCHPKIQAVLSRVIEFYDFSVLEGHRDQDDQEEAFRTGASNKHWPDSRHNAVPSEAVDVAPYPIDWDDEEEFYYLAGLIMGVAQTMGIRLRWGGRWKDPHDCPHFELDMFVN